MLIKAADQLVCADVCKLASSLLLCCLRLTLGTLVMSNRFFVGGASKEGVSMGACMNSARAWCSSLSPLLPLAHLLVGIGLHSEGNNCHRFDCLSNKMHPMAENTNSWDSSGAITKVLVCSRNSPVSCAHLRVTQCLCCARGESVVISPFCGALYSRISAKEGGGFFFGRRIPLCFCAYFMC